MRYRMVRGRDNLVADCLDTVIRLLKHDYMFYEDVAVFRWDKEQDKVLAFLPFVPSSREMMVIYDGEEFSECEYTYVYSTKQVPKSRELEEAGLRLQLEANEYKVVPYKRLGSKLLTIYKELNARELAAV